MDETLVMQTFKELLEKSKGPGLCNKRNVHAALITKSGDIYYGQNGYKDDPCSEKGHHHCTREKGPAEYVGSCPSFCAEGPAILDALGSDYESLDSVIDALFSKKILKGSTFITTDFPCERCASIIIDAGIKEIYFGNYKEDEPRLRDAHSAAQMILSGVNIYRVLEFIDGDNALKYVVKKRDPGYIMKSFASGKARTSGEAFFRMFFDESYGVQVRRAADFMKENFDPFIKVDPSCFVFPDKWSYERHP